MRTPKYLSPTSIGVYQSSPEEFYQQYLSDNPPPRRDQTRPMSVGSAFDAYVKAHLYKEFIGGGDPTYEFEALFEAQVNDYNRSWARVAGKVVFDSYVKMGGLADLLSMMMDCKNPRMEFRLEGSVTAEDLEAFDGTPRTIDFWMTGSEEPVSITASPPPMVLMGKPDLHFLHESGTSIILDWKVNGFCAKRKPTAGQGYMAFMDGSGGPYLGHKKCEPGNFGGVTINTGYPLNEVNKDWARQTAIYGWLMGEPVGGDFIAAIDQIICSDGNVHGVAQHRSLISREFQTLTYEWARRLWFLCHSDWFFWYLPHADSTNKCAMFDRPLDAEFAEVMNRV